MRRGFRPPHVFLQGPEAFDGFYNDACAIKAEFHVTGNTTIKIDGEIVTPKTQFCKGNVSNFTVELQVPHGNGSGAMVTVPADAVYFDWFFGENREGQIADPQAQYVEINETYGVSLKEGPIRNLLFLDETGDTVHYTDIREEISHDIPYSEYVKGE